MRIANSVLSPHLADVYWITGGACAGKTTVTALLSEKHGFSVFPDRMREYQNAADFNEFPSMRYPRPSTDWEWFFNRDVDSYAGWLEENIAAQLEYQSGMGGTRSGELRTARRFP